VLQTHIKLFVILLMVLLICFKTQAQSSLPKCKGTDFSKWSDCFGSETFYGGKTYVGEYEMGTPNGYGTETWPNGEQYIGQWYMGSKHGQGTFTYDDGTDDKGIWKLDELIERQ